MKRLALALAFALALSSASAQVPPTPGTTQGVPITASSGNVAAATAAATLAAGGANKITYICGFQATAGGATAAAVVTLTVTNLVTGTISFTYCAQTGAARPTAPLALP